MRTRRICKALTYSLVCLVCVKPNLALAGKIRDQAMSRHAQMLGQMEKAETLADKQKLVIKYSNELERLRATSKRQSELDENFLDLLTLTIKNIPLDKSFETRDCKKYRSSILFELDPQAENQAKEPGVKEGIAILDRLCGKSKIRR